jgi:hypothetical protein
VTRVKDCTPERFFPERCRLAQSSGEWPGDRSTLPRAFGVLSADPAAMGTPSPAFGLRFGTGPRFGSGSVVGTRNEGASVGRARRFEGLAWGGGMRDATAGRGGGAIGGAARCAEFIAGKEGGGRSSSSSSELSCAASVNVGAATPSCEPFGTAFGVVCGDGEDRELSIGSGSVWA